MSYILRPNWVGYVSILFYSSIMAAPLFGGCFFAFLSSKSLREYGPQSASFFAFFSIILCLAASFFFSYMVNSFTYYVTISKELVEFKSGERRFSIRSDAIKGVHFLTGGKGWRYIEICSNGAKSIITNSLYSNKAFDELTKNIMEWIRDFDKDNTVVVSENDPKKFGKQSFRLYGFARNFFLAIGLAVIVFGIDFTFRW